jgi:hypothetical protein
VLFSHLNNNVTSKGKRCNRSVTLRLARSQQRRVELVTETRRQRTEVNPPRRAAPTKKQQRGRRRAGYHITKLSLLCSMVGERERERGGGQEEEEPRFLNLLRVILQLSNALVKIFKARCDTCNDAILKDCGRSSGREIKSS